MAGRTMDGLRAAGLRPGGKAGTLGGQAAGAARPPGHLEHPPLPPGLEAARRPVRPLPHRGGPVGGQKRPPAVADPLSRPDVSGGADELQAHRGVPGAGRQLGLRPGTDPGRGPPGERTQPVRLHRGGHRGLRGGGGGGVAGRASSRERSNCPS